MRLTIEQSDTDPSVFVPKDDITKKILSLLGMSRLTVADVNEIKSIPIEFIFSYEEVPIGGRLKIDSQTATWYNKVAKQYFGRKLDKKGSLYTATTATGRTQDEVIDKLLGRDA